MRVGSILAAGVLAAQALAGVAVAGPALLFEPQSGKVLYAEDPDNLWHPASLTKIMTAYLTFEAIKAGKLTLETRIPYSEAASVQPPSKIGLAVGAELSVDLALQALIVKSANDVAVMLAEAVGGSEAQFVERMNATARRLGMSKTRFVNPNGLPAADQVTTARDLARLARAVLKDFPQYAPYWAQQETQIGAVKVTSHNGLLKNFEGADGLKTGFICDSGFNVVASATRDGRKLMAVVLGETSGAERTLRAASMLEHGFLTWGWKTMFASTTIENLSVSPASRGLSTMRDIGIKWECGARKQVKRVAKAKSAKGKQPDAAAKAAPAASPAQPASVAGAPVEKSVSKPKPKAAAAAPAQKAQ